MMRDRGEQRRCRWARLAVVGAALWLVPAVAFGQAGPGDTGGSGEPSEAELQRARTLFSEGVELVDGGNWRAAAEKFRSALEIKATPAVRYNLASALYESDRVTQAHIEVQRVLDNDETSPGIRRRAEELATRIDREAAQVTPELEGGTEGVTVRVDDRELPAARTGAPVAVSAGEHTVTAHRDGRQVAEQTVSVDKGETATATLRVAPSPEEAAAASSGEQPSSSERQLATDWRLWAGVGAGVLLVTVAIAVGVAAGGGTEDPIQGDFQPGVLTWK